MRVVMPFARKDGGGSVVSGALFAKMLTDLGHEVVVVSPQHGYVCETFSQHGIDSTVLDIKEGSISEGGAGELIKNTFRLFSSARRYLKSNSVDVVHINDDTTLLGWAAAAKLQGIKVVWHVRQGHFGRQDKVRAKLCDASIAISDYVLQRTSSLLPSVRIYNPVEFVPEYFIHPEGRPLKLLFVGRPVKYKRVEWALRALQGLLNEYGDDSALLQIAGAWSEQQRNGLLAELPSNVRSQVDFLGHKSNLSDYYRTADLLLHPALNEAFGRVLIEAQAFSLPVVTTRSGGAKEIVTHRVNGIAVEPDDEAGYVASVLELTKSPELRQQLAARAHEGIQNNFSLDACSAQLKHFYDTHI